jgi:hypothetical protein
VALVERAQADPKNAKSLDTTNQADMKAIAFKVYEVETVAEINVPCVSSYIF